MAVFSPRSHPIRNIRKIRGPSGEISAPLTTEAMMSIRPESLGDAKKMLGQSPPSHPPWVLRSAGKPDYSFRVKNVAPGDARAEPGRERF